MQNIIIKIGSSVLYKELGNHQAKILIDQTLLHMIQICDQQQGVLIKTIGDEIMVRFDTAMNAVIAAFVPAAPVFTVIWQFPGEKVVSH